MNINMKKIALVMFLFCAAINLKAQKGKFSIGAMTGVATGILDNGWGVHLGANPHISINRHFAAEFQVSYTYFKTTGSFLSGDTGKSNTLNALSGVRFYFNSEEKKVRPYINLLIGAQYNKTQKDDISSVSSSSLEMGFSTGFFLDVNQFLVGVSFDTPEHILLKVGYDIPIKKAK